jgi:hypothetical protein
LKITIDEDELVMTTLNGLTRPWDALFQTICARKEKLQFDSVWEECVQEEARVANREALLSRDEDQALATHTKGERKKSYFQIKRKMFQRSDATTVKSWDTFPMTVLKEKGKESIKHMWQRKRNLLPQRKL